MMSLTIAGTTVLNSLVKVLETRQTEQKIAQLLRSKVLYSLKAIIIGLNVCQVGPRVYVHSYFFRIAALMTHKERC